MLFMKVRRRFREVRIHLTLIGLPDPAKASWCQSCSPKSAVLWAAQFKAQPKRKRMDSRVDIGLGRPLGACPSNGHLMLEESGQV